MDAQREPRELGLRGRHPAADRLNLIRVMPAQGWWRGTARPDDEEKATVPDDTQRPAEQARRRRRAAEAIARPKTAAPEALDAVVVGGGAIGLACAWRAARRGVRVRVLERDHPGAGASHVAAGMLAPVGEASWGEEALMRLALASARAWPGFAAELAADSELEVGYEPCGALHVALDRDEAEELRRRFELMDSLDLGVEWLRPRACRDLEPGLAPACAAGVHAPAEAAVDPRPAAAGPGRRGRALRRPGARRGRGHGRADRRRSPGRGDHRGRARAPRRARGAGHRRLVGSRALAAARWRDPRFVP